MATEREREMEMADRILKAIEKRYGFVPLISQVLSERPDLFIPATNVGRAATEGIGKLERKVRFLVALSAAAITGSEHCLRVQMEHAIEAGATRDEVLETLYIASYMAMTGSQSRTLRIFKEKFDNDGK